MGSQELRLLPRTGQDQGTGKDHPGQRTEGRERDERGSNAADKAAIRRATYAAHRAKSSSILLRRSRSKPPTGKPPPISPSASRRTPGRMPTSPCRKCAPYSSRLRERLRALSDTRNTLINVSLERAAELGTEPFSAEIKSAAAMRVSDEAMRFVRNFVAEDGLQLSDRLWRLDRGARDKVVNAIEQAVILGQGAAQAAREFLARGESVFLFMR